LRLTSVPDSILVFGLIKHKIMDQRKKLRTANVLRNIARYTLLIMGILVFIFALLSGAEGYGGGIDGIIKNSPNALPWLFLLLIIYIAWKWELIGGLLIVLSGFATMYFFVFGQNFFLSTFILSLLIIILGGFFISSWYLRRKDN